MGKGFWRDKKRLVKELQSRVLDLCAELRGRTLLLSTQPLQRQASQLAFVFDPNQENAKLESTQDENEPDCADNSSDDSNESVRGADELQRQRYQPRNVTRYRRMGSRSVVLDEIEVDI